MTTEAKIQLTSTEVGILWITYIFTTGRLMINDSLTLTTIDKEAQNILTFNHTDVLNIKNQLTNIFNTEQAVIPIGFDERDVFKDAPPLFDDIFHIMFLRQMKKLNLGHNAVFTAMSYKKEVQDLLKLNYDISYKYYVIATNYLLAKGVLARPPYMTMPKQVEFIENKNYMSGFNIFSDKRSLNTVEIGYMYEAVEDSIFLMQLMTGFAQVALDGEVKQYFVEGKELSKKIISELSSILLKSDIQPPSTWAGKATDSTKPPFTDKLMMYIVSIFSTTALGFTALGTSFSMRNDLPLTLGLISKDTYEFARKGSKLMIKHKWMEEPPQIDDRNSIINNK
jgi:hypothetical protein